MGNNQLALVCALFAASVYASDSGAVAEAAEFQEIGGGSTTSYASAVSGDGQVVAGFSSDGTVGYRWTEADGVTTFAFQPTDVSLHGEVIVGVRVPFEAVRWTQADGAVGLDDLTPGDGSIYSSALGVSADGSVVVGGTAIEPFVWTSTDGMKPSPEVPPESGNGFNSGVSADGTVTAGGYSGHYFRSVNGTPSEIYGISLLSSASGISGDGEVIFGQVSNQAAFWSAGTVTTVGTFSSWFEGASSTGDCLAGTSMTDSMMTAIFWDDVNGLRDLETVLENDFGLAPELNGWTLEQANDVSDDCRTIVGTGNYQGSKQAWIVTGFSKDRISTTTTLSTTTTTVGEQSRCSQPLSSVPSPIASDCLFILKVAVGSETCLPPCVCAPKGTLPTAATDALLCLKAAVGESVELACPCAG